MNPRRGRAQTGAVCCDEFKRSGQLLGSVVSSLVKALQAIARHSLRKTRGSRWDTRGVFSSMNPRRGRAQTGAVCCDEFKRSDRRGVSSSNAQTGAVCCDEARCVATSSNAQTGAVYRVQTLRQARCVATSSNLVQPCDEQLDWCNRVRPSCVVRLPRGRRMCEEPCKGSSDPRNPTIALHKTTHHGLFCTCLQDRQRYICDICRGYRHTSHRRSCWLLKWFWAGPDFNDKFRGICLDYG